MTTDLPESVRSLVKLLTHAMQANKLDSLQVQIPFPHKKDELNRDVLVKVSVEPVLAE